MRLEDINILHINNVLDYSGVPKIVYQLSVLGNENFKCVKVASAGGIYVEKLTDTGIEHFEIPDLSTKNPVKMLRIAGILEDIVNKYDINVIHCHHRMALFYVKLLFPKIKILYNNHTTYSDKRLFTKILLNNVSIIADGRQAFYNMTQFFGVPEKQITIINNAVDNYDGRFSEIKEIAIEKHKGKFIVANASRLHIQKGVCYFVDAADILVKKGYRIHFFIIGDGILENEIKEQIKKNNLESYVTMLGFRKDIKNVLLQTDILVQTSIYEGLPLTPMEAFSVKKAVVATNIEGTKEVVEHEYNGLLAETQNPMAIAEAIERLYLDRDLLKKLEKNAYETFQKKFSLPAFVEAYLKYYADI